MDSYSRAVRSGVVNEADRPEQTSIIDAVARDAVYCLGNRGETPDYGEEGGEDSEMGGRIETGSCFCGAIAAEMHGEPFWICYDHDDDCRRAIGSPLNVWVGYRPNQFRVARGKPKSFSRTSGVIRTFCSECGTSIGYLDDGLSDELYLAIGFLDNPERFEPQAHAYWRMKLPWVDFADELPRVDRYSRTRDPAVGEPAAR